MKPLSFTEKCLLGISAMWGYFWLIGAQKHDEKMRGEEVRKFIQQKNEPKKEMPIITPYIPMNIVPEPLKTELLWLGFSKDSHISKHMYNVIVYCHDYKTEETSKINKEIREECKKQHRHAWSFCYGGQDHTVFGGGFYPEAEMGHMNNNFKYWFNTYLMSIGVDLQMCKLLMELEN